MRKLKNLFIFLSVFFVVPSMAQENGIDNSVVSFKKRELTSGIVFDVNREREELLTDKTRFYEERTLLNAKFRFENRLWNLLDYKQERLYINFEAGPLGGYGDWIDETNIENITADQNFYGLRTSANIDYLYRYYYDAKSFTVIDIGAWGRYDWIKQNLEGTSTDSLGVVTPIDESDMKDKFRYGVSAKVGWGTGRLSPMNHLMTAHYLLEKYYPGRVFSDIEIAQFAQVIANVKHNRSFKKVRILGMEMEELVDFIKSKFVLASSELMATDWQFSEFNPRYEGNRFEIGPHFSYYNREPDFLYGIFLQYDNAKFVNVHWNRNFSVGLVYKRYTKEDLELIEDTWYNNSTSRDWATADINFGWSYYPNLKTHFNFGLRCIPGIQINNFEDMGDLSFNFIPYIGYFTQLSSSARMQFDIAWRFADGDKFILPGPEFSLAFYRSKY